MDTLIKSLESRGCSVVISVENDKRVNAARVAGEKIQFRMRELLEKREMTPTEKKQHQHRPWLYRFAPHVYFPSGRFVLSIEEYLDAHNDDPKPFVWTATAESILQKVRRGRVALQTISGQ